MKQPSPSNSISPPEPSPDGAQQLGFHEMDGHSMGTEDDPTYSAALWDWGDILDLTVDDHVSISFDSDQQQLTPTPSISAAAPPPLPQNQLDSSGTVRVRKRDPRLVCSNFLAGRVPCSCPEVDEQLAEEEEEEGELPGKKRARKVRVGGRSGKARCQVPGCEVDISELKGYHRRHRVCLRCANASSVLLDGETKRYCQQCGKFHVLSDFDEGKRSCRRKLERHNTRRRRKPADSRGSVDMEHQGTLQNEDITCDDDGGKDSLCVSDPIADQEALLEFEEQHVSTLNSANMSQTVVPFPTSLETTTDGGKDNAKYSLSSSYCDNKSAYSTLCPTGRISFKLYDWNPAEFPRRLRHQIFEWLASMPVELEGYIRPGCTILTVFIAMPENMWVKLFEDPMTYVHDFIVKPGKMLSGRGSITVYLNHMIFRVIEGGTSVMKVDVKMQAPKLHYVHPMCFEAGKPIEFIACGSNLLQPKLRFLVSFAGKYMVHNYCVASLHSEAENNSSFDHQLYKIQIRQTEPNLFGPAFIEVENESGLSNFIPVLIGDEETCSEIRSIQQKFGRSLFPKGQQFEAKNLLPNSCEKFVVRQKAVSELLLDIAWLLKEPASESIQQTIASCQIQRLNCLLSFLIDSKSITILEKVLQNLKSLVGSVELDSKDDDSCSNDDVKLLHRHLNSAREVLNEKHRRSANSVLHPENLVAETNCGSQSSSQGDILSTIPAIDQDIVTRVDSKSGMMVASTTMDGSETDPLLNREVVMNVDLVKEWPRKSCGHVFSGTILRSHPTLFLISIAAICFGVCAILFHPQEVGEFAVSIRRCLFDKL